MGKPNVLKEEANREAMVGSDIEVAHFHRGASGKLVKCYHKCKSLLADPSFWLGVTMSFPLEHTLYEKVWPFTLVTHYLDLLGK